MHDVVEVACTVLCHMHLVVFQTCYWIAVSGRHQAVVLFLYSEHLPLCVCAKTPLYIKDVWKHVDRLLWCCPQSILWLVEITSSAKALLFTIKCADSSLVFFHMLCQFLFGEILNNDVRLKCSHYYYYGVQGAMATLDRRWCDFIEWTTKDMTVKRIQLFWSSCFTNLQNIYLKLFT